jgi:hypothetical protein
MLDFEFFKYIALILLATLSIPLPIYIFFSDSVELATLQLALAVLQLTLATLQ